MTKPALSTLLLPFLLAATAASSPTGAQTTGSSIATPVSREALVMACTRDQYMVKMRGFAVDPTAPLTDLLGHGGQTAEGVKYARSSQIVFGKMINHLHSYDFAEASGNGVVTERTSQYGPGVKAVISAFNDNNSKRATPYKFHIVMYGIVADQRCKLPEYQKGTFVPN